MQTVILQASPRKRGNTNTLVERFVAGLRDGGAGDAHVFHLNDMRIRPCQACYACQASPEAACAQQDDMQQIYPRVAEARVLVFAFPIYWWHMAAQMKLCLDRFLALIYQEDPRHLDGKRAALIATYGVEDPEGVDQVIRMFQTIAKWAHMKLDIVRYCSGQAHVSECPDKLAEAYDLGLRIAREEKTP